VGIKYSPIYQIVAIAWPHGESDILAAAIRHKKPAMTTEKKIVSTLSVLGRIMYFHLLTNGERVSSSFDRYVYLRTNTDEFLTA
jgi:hypothetical protein